MMIISRRSLLINAALAPTTLAAPVLLRLADRASAADATTGQVVNKTPQYQRRMIGDIEVIALMDGMIKRPKEMIPGYDESRASMAAKLAHKPHQPEAIAIGINGYVIRTADRVIVVDTGSPAGLAPTLGGWHAALAAAGIAVDDVDTIFLTHLHPDHVGGLTDLASGAPRFPKAHIIASQTDWTFTFDAGVYASMPKEVQQGLDLSRAMVTPYEKTRVLLKPGDEITPGMTTVAMPGHTPGHIGLRVDSGPESLLIWGDLLIIPAYQFANPAWGFALDTDKEEAAVTRARILDMTASNGIMVAGMHLDFPGFGYVERAKQGYGFVAAPWDYRI